MKYKAIIAIGICAIFMLTITNSVIAKNVIENKSDVVDDENTDPAPESPLDSKYLRIKVRGNEIEIFVKFPWKFIYDNYDAVLEITVTKSSNELFHFLHDSTGETRISNHVRISITSNSKFFGICKVNTKVTGIEGYEDLYKENTATGIVFGNKIIAFGDTF